MAISDRAGLAPELCAQLPLGAHDLVQLLDDVHGHPDRARLVRQRARHGLPNPPRRVRRELEAFAVVELLGRAHQPDRALLDQIEERQPLVAVALRDRDDEAQIRLDHLLLRGMVSALDPLRKLDLLRRGEQLDPPDVLEEQLQRVRRRLERARLDGRPFVVRLDRLGHDLDLLLLERLEQLVELTRLEVEIVEGERDLLRGHRPAFPCGVDQCPRLVRVENIVDALRCRLNLAQRSPTPLAGRFGRSGSVAAVSDSRHRPNGSSFDHLVLTFSRRFSSTRASLANSVSGSSATASCSSRRAWSNAPSQMESSPRWKRTVCECGKRRASGPSRPKATRRMVLVVEADGRGDLSVGIARRGSRCGGELTLGARRAARSAGAARLGRAAAAPACQPRAKLGWNCGSPRGEFGWSRSPARTAEGVSGWTRFACLHAARAQRRPAASRARGRD